MKKIDLDKIINNNKVHDFIDDDGDNMIVLFKKYLLESYIEFGKQLLELASENACGVHCTDYVDKQSILNTIKQIKYEK